MRYGLLFLFVSLLAFAQFDGKLTIEKKADERIRIGIVDGSIPSETTRTLHKIFVADLKISGQFRPQERYLPGTYTGNLIDPALRGLDYVLVYKFLPGSSPYTLWVKLLNAANGSMLSERRYRIASRQKYPFLVHKAVAEIARTLRLPSIDWINRYVVFARYTGRKQSEIVLADYTFHFTKVIIRGGLNLFPHWGDSEQKSIYYTSYVEGRPTLFRLNIYTGERTQITSSTGMLACSDVSSDGQRLILTMAPGGQSDIYEYDLKSHKAKQLTTYQGIDVNGVYADAGASLVFVSNRLGYPNVFKKTFATGAVQQIVFAGKNNNSVDAYGDTVVYSAREGQGVFNLYTAHTDATPGRPLTSNGVNQFPRFSPDGQTILYIKRSYEGNAVGYLSLKTNQSLLFPLGERKIQSLDW